MAPGRAYRLARYWTGLDCSADVTWPGEANARGVAGGMAVVNAVTGGGRKLWWRRRRWKSCSVAWTWTLPYCPAARGPMPGKEAPRISITRDFSKCTHAANSCTFPLVLKKINFCSISEKKMFFFNLTKKIKNSWKTLKNKYFFQPV